MGKVLSFLILLLVSQSLLSQEIFLNNGQTIVDIDPKGSFLPIDQVAGFPPFDVPPNSATSIDVSNLPAGSLIKVKRLGSLGFGPGYPDETSFIYTMGVFVDSSGNQIAAGPKTNANPFGPVFFCPTFPSGALLDLPYDFDLTGNGLINDKDFILEVPSGASKLLVAPADCPVQDNDDPNNNYKLHITYPLIDKVDIYQVVKNPILYTPSTTIDLVAGKNADIVVKTAPNVNVEGSYIEWRDVNNSEPTKKIFNLKPGQTTSTSSGDITFYIDPVPKESEFIGNVTHPTIHLRGKNSFGVIVDIDQSNSQLVSINIRKTKPIKIGFIPISGCNDVIYCFAPANVVQASEISQYGGEIMRAMYPVADDEFEINMIGQPQSIFRSKKSLESALNVIADDFKALDRNRLRKKNDFFNLNTEYTVGVVDISYFESKNMLSIVGIAPILMHNYLKYYTPTALVSKDYYYILSHEFGHLLGGLTDPSNNYNYAGYSNYSLSSSWDITRGFLNEKETLMGHFTPLTKYKNFMSHRWIGRDEYIEIFKNSIFKNVKIKANNSLIRLTGTLENGSITSVSAFSHSGEINDLIDNGNYVAKVTDAKGNILNYNVFQPVLLSEINSEVFKISINKPLSAMFVNFYKKQDGKEILIHKIAIPSELIRDTVAHIDKNLIIGDIDTFNKIIDFMLKKMSDNLISGKFQESLKNLTDEIIPFLNKNISSLKSTQTSSFLSDLSEIQRTNYESLAVLVGSVNSIQTPKNPYVQITLLNSSQLGQKSILAINQGISPINSNYMYIYQAFFDGIENKVIPNGQSYISESSVLNQGLHQWLVKTFLIERRLYNNFQEAINKYELRVYKLMKEYEMETDPLKKQIIQDKIYNAEGLVLKMKNEQLSLMKEIGNHVFVNFEVL